MKNNRYWMAVISKDHILKGREGGFIQVCHGKKTPLTRMKKDDWIIVYSPKLAMEGKEKCQTFTAIGRVNDENIYPYQMSKDFIPFRRNIQYFDSCEIPILPLIDHIDFIQNKKLWGYPFRFGFFEIKESDFRIIAEDMLKNEIPRKSIQC